ncbi:4Fe-4S dicluster domain-containing protein [Halarsenatibacter silvermanii]|uniref:Formate dehydrogenase iron-sulfur subunit n=1 Tax=Halarsenatibacter silvermanii TaxID=321763 RepID=A0A1G9MXN5_9FIRM|nr:4Fe-4S dicluster domain-containing protein [Halarsenatibacter silvermanii]SDL78687.1 formate dehydrogenase iron-sulfur subunit [Halarsenatibacter silvermanii]
MTEMAILNDVTSCMGCKACQTACKQWNELPAEETKFQDTGSYQNPADLSRITWNLLQFTEWEDGDEVNWDFSRRACVHCTDAHCIDICPPEAISHTEEGFVIIDREACVACGMCEEACPYDVPNVEEIAAKCTFCIDRVRNNLEPACVKACSTDALIYGERDKLLERAHAAADEDPDYKVYGEEELEGLHVIYVLPGESERFQLSRDPRPGDMVYLLKALKYCLPGSLACKVGAKLIGGSQKRKKRG